MGHFRDEQFHSISSGMACSSLLQDHRWLLFSLEQLRVPCSLPLGPVAHVMARPQGLPCQSALADVGEGRGGTNHFIFPGHLLPQ